jgi:transposase
MGRNEPMIPEAAPGNHPRRAAKREIVEAILYLLRASCSWRLLSHDSPAPGRRSITNCPAGSAKGVWARVHHALFMADRERAGREASPFAAIINSLAVSTVDQKGGSQGMVKGDRGPSGAA